MHERRGRRVVDAAIDDLDQAGEVVVGGETQLDPRGTHN
jgi:hypothetical protein